MASLSASRKSLPPGPTEGDSMEPKGGPDAQAGPWEAFALAAIAPLGPFSQVHLAPKIPPNLLSNALVGYLLLERDELLLAIIGGGKPDGCCALTTRRIYWDEVADAAKDEAPARGWPARLKRAKRSVLVRRAVGYAELPEAIRLAEAGKGTFQLDLGARRPLPLSGVDAALARRWRAISSGWDGQPARVGPHHRRARPRAGPAHSGRTPRCRGDDGQGAAHSAAS